MREMSISIDPAGFEGWIKQGGMFEKKMDFITVIEAMAAFKNGEDAVAFNRKLIPVKTPEGASGWMHSKYVLD